MNTSLNSAHDPLAIRETDNKISGHRRSALKLTEFTQH